VGGRPCAEIQSDRGERQPATTQARADDLAPVEGQRAVGEGQRAADSLDRTVQREIAERRQQAALDGAAVVA
jgi:hypothetical protein